MKVIINPGHTVEHETGTYGPGGAFDIDAEGAARLIGLGAVHAAEEENVAEEVAEKKSRKKVAAKTVAEESETEGDKEDDVI